MHIVSHSACFSLCTYLLIYMHIIGTKCSEIIMVNVFLAASRRVGHFSCLSNLLHNCNQTTSDIHCFCLCLSVFSFVGIFQPKIEFVRRSSLRYRAAFSLCLSVRFITATATAADADQRNKNIIKSIDQLTDRPTGPPTQTKRRERKRTDNKIILI